MAARIFVGRIGSTSTDPLLGETEMNDPSEFEFHESWQSFRYLADEMSDDERASFEVRLANNEQAVESLIECCGLTETIFRAFESEASDASVSTNAKTAQVSLTAQVSRSTKTDAPKRASVWFSQVACVVAIVCVGVAFWYRGDSERATRIAQAEVNAELARHWESAAVVVPLETALVSEFESNDSQPTVDEINEVKAEHVPEWLLVALRSQQDSDSKSE